MEVLIKNISYSSNEKYSVIFTTTYGEAAASWKGDHPVINQSYDVELEFNDILDLVPVLNNDSSDTIGVDKQSVFIIGKLESIEGDGYSVIKIGSSIVAVILDTAKNKFLGMTVKMTAKSLTIYDSNSP